MSPSPKVMGNLADGLSIQAHTRPDKTAIYLPTWTLNFAHLEILTWRGATFLSHQGVRPGDVLAVACTGELALMVVMIASARIGATLISIAPKSPWLLQQETMKAAQAQYVVTDRPEVNGHHRPVIFFDLEALSESTAPIDRAVRVAKPQAPWLIISGSGSTGKAKMIPVGHRQFAARMDIYNQALSISPVDRVASLFPLTYATPQQRCLEALFAGASLVLRPSRSGDLIQWIQHAQVSVLYSTVPLAEKLLKPLPQGTYAALRTLRVFMLGSSVVSRELRIRIQEKLTRNLFVYYGMNEFGLATISMPSNSTTSLETVGHPPPGVTVEVVDADGKVLPTGEIGLVRGKSPGMCHAYLNDQATSQQTFRDGWFYPGDLGRFQANGDLTFCGRSDHMMNMSGINIYPAEIEAVITQHPAVWDVAAVPLRHPVRQDIPICAVAFHEGQEATEDQLLSFAFQQLGARSPRRIVVLRRIPRNEQGKLLRAELLREIGEILERAQPPKPID